MQKTVPDQKTNNYHSTCTIPADVLNTDYHNYVKISRIFRSIIISQLAHFKQQILLQSQNQITVNVSL